MQAIVCWTRLRGCAIGHSNGPIISNASSSGPVHANLKSVLCQGIRCTAPPSTEAHFRADCLSMHKHRPAPGKLKQDTAKKEALQTQSYVCCMWRCRCQRHVSLHAHRPVLCCPRHSRHRRVNPGSEPPFSCIMRYIPGSACTACRANGLACTLSVRSPRRDRALSIALRVGMHN